MIGCCAYSVGSRAGSMRRPLLREADRARLRDGNHPDLARHERDAAPLGDQHAAPPAKGRLAVGAEGRRLPDPDVALLDAHVAAALAAIARSEQGTVVAAAATVHQDVGLHAALRAVPVDEV